VRAAPHFERLTAVVADVDGYEVNFKGIDFQGNERELPINFAPPAAEIRLGAVDPIDKESVGLAFAVFWDFARCTLTELRDDGTVN
jgi:hypothetical protein